MLKYLVFTYYKHSPSPLLLISGILGVVPFSITPFPALGLAQCSVMGSGPSSSPEEQPINLCHLPGNHLMGEECDWKFRSLEILTF